jgi:hypothetical protein
VVGGSLDMVDGKYESVSRTMIYVDGSTRGLLKVFEFPLADLAPPKWVPHDAVNYSAFNWNVLGAYDAIESLVDGPPFGQPGKLGNMIDQIADAAGGPGVHIKKDIVEKVAGLEEFPGQAHEVNGVTIYEFELPVPEAPANGGMGVINDHLMISSDVTVLEQIIESGSDQKALVDTDSYKKIAGEFPKQASIVGYQKQEAQIQAVYEMLRNEELPLPMQGFDFSKLPPFEAIAKYLPTVGSYVVPDENGAVFISYSLREGK